MYPQSLNIAMHFARTRWGLNFHDREQLKNWQDRKLGEYLTDILPLAPRFHGKTYQSVHEIPIMDKSIMMDAFEAYNTCGISFEQARKVALQAETSRDFSPMIGELTVGMSSGTSGNQGIFLVSRQERLRWAGILLARALPEHLLKQLILPWRKPLRIAFFLRANSNLYTTLTSRRIDFNFYDLLKGIQSALPRLNASQPDILVAPSSVLRALCAEVQNGQLRINPSHIISVAEVLEGSDRQLIKDAFGLIPHQLYQATEGFLAYTCEAGSLHLNESFVHIEPEWLDDSHSRFQPVITDFSRHTQLIVRYRLNDILRVSERACPCGRVERSIDAIEGRTDEILWLPSSANEEAVAIFPELVRRAFLFTHPEVREYSICQDGMNWNINLLAVGELNGAISRTRDALSELWKNLSVRAPALHFGSWQPPADGNKRLRMRMLRPPQGITCTF